MNLPEKLPVRFFNNLIQSSCIFYFTLIMNFTLNHLFRHIYSIVKEKIQTHHQNNYYLHVYTQIA